MVNDTLHPASPNADSAPFKALKDYPPATQALRKYRMVLDEYLGPDNHDIMQRHIDYLKRQVRDYERRISGMLADTGNEVAQVHAGHLQFKVEAMKKALTVLQHPDENGNKRVLTQLKKGLEHARRLLGHNGPDSLEQIDQDESTAFVEEIYGHSRRETYDAYKMFDKFFAVGIESALDKLDKDDRASAYYLVPMDINYAKWTCMLALQDGAYDLGIAKGKGSDGRDYDTRELEMLGRMFAYLAENERGALNAHMAPEHKLRHNPAIHTLHVVTLSNKLIDKVNMQLDKYFEGDDLVRARTELAAFKRRMALVHILDDMGEMEGEFSELGRIQGWTPKRREIYEATRYQTERDVFASNLRKHAKAVGFTPAEVESLEKFYTESYDAPKDRSFFSGRWPKAVDKIQSQQDYFRFQGMNKNGDVPTLAEPPIPKSVAKDREALIRYLTGKFDVPFLSDVLIEKRIPVNGTVLEQRVENSELSPEQLDALVKHYAHINRTNSLGYVSKILNGNPKASDAERLSLGDLAYAEADPVKQKLALLLTEQVEDEYIHLMDQMGPAYIPGIPSHFFHPSMMKPQHFGVIKPLQEQRGVK